MAFLSSDAERKPDPMQAAATQYVSSSLMLVAWAGLLPTLPFQCLLTHAMRDLHSKFPGVYGDHPCVLCRAESIMDSDRAGCTKSKGL